MRAPSAGLRLLAHGVVAALQVRLAFSTPGRPGAPLPLLGGGEQPDWAGTVWTWWWVGEAVRSGESVLGAGRNFQPVGQWPLAWFNLVDAFTFAPLLHLLGPRVGYNVACAAILVMNGLAGGALVRATGGSRSAALVAGLLVQTSGFVALELLQGRAGQAWVAPALLALAALAGAVRRGGLPRAITAGALVALTGYAYWFYGMFLAFAGGIFAAAGPASRRARGRILAVAGAVTLAVVAPAAAVLASSWAAQPGVVGAADPVVAAEPLARGLQSLAFAIRTAHWPLWPVLDAPGDLTDKRLHPVAVALALLGVTAARRGKAAWLGILGLGYLLTLGPYLRGWSGVTAIPLPWLVLHDWMPFFSRLWWPERAELLVLAALAVLAGWGVDRLPGRPLVWAAGLGLLVSRHLALPAGPVPPVDLGLYADLDGTLVTVPVMGDDDHGRKLLWAQAHHGRPILAGLGDHLPGHRPPGYASYIHDNALLDALHTLSIGPLEPTQVAPRDISSLQEAGFAWVVADTAGVRPGFERPWLEAWRRTLQPVLGPPDVVRPTGLAWRLEVPDGPVVLPAHPAVEAGVRDQQLAPLQRGRPGPPPPRRVRGSGVVE